MLNERFRVFTSFAAPQKRKDLLPIFCPSAPQCRSVVNFPKGWKRRIFTKCVELKRVVLLAERETKRCALGAKIVSDKFPVVLRSQRRYLVSCLGYSVLLGIYTTLQAPRMAPLWLTMGSGVAEDADLSPRRGPFRFGALEAMFELFASDCRPLCVCLVALQGCPIFYGPGNTAD